MLVNAVVLISGGQTVRTPQLEPIENIQAALDYHKALKWDPRKSHLLLKNLDFFNDQEFVSSRLGHITLEKVSRMVYPFGFYLVAPLVISGLDTLLMMSK